MSRIGSMMSVGKQALANSQTALQTTTHNIANANTEGYSRQRIDSRTAEPISEGHIRLGQGVRAAGVDRVVNNFLNKQIQDETSKLGLASGREGHLARVESIFNESVNKGLNGFLAKFFNSFREFANNPESKANRALVAESARELTEDFHRVNDQLNAVQKDVDAQVTNQLSQVNGYVKEIAGLNEKIPMIEVQGMKANDERDRRELLVKKLGELINIRYAEGDNGKLTITAGNTAVLVSGAEFNEMFARSTPAHDNKREGNVDIVFKYGPQGTEFVVTREIKGGQIGGALEVRDNVVNSLHENIDEIAFTVVHSVNDIHKTGFDRYDNTGREFFNSLEDEFLASSEISLHDDIMTDPGHIASGMMPKSPGDNRIANQIASLQSEKLFSDNTTTIDDFFNGMVGEFAVLTKRNNMVFEHQKNIVAQLNNVRESVSGVSLDEETTDMVKYQKAFDTSARLIKVADEMFDTVLNLKRL